MNTINTVLAEDFIPGKVTGKVKDDITVINNMSLETETIRPERKGEFSAVLQPGEYRIKSEIPVHSGLINISLSEGKS